MKISTGYFASLLLLASTSVPEVASQTLRGVQGKKTLPNGQTCNFCPDEDDWYRAGDEAGTDTNARALSALKTAAEAANTEATFLNAAANKKGIKAEQKTKLLAAAEAAKYEGSVLGEAADMQEIGVHHERLLNDKKLPNG